MADYRYNIKNQFRPSALVTSVYGWSSGPAYNRADVPTALLNMGPSTITAEQLLQQFSYEWFESGDPNAMYTNPPFVGGAAGRLNPNLVDVHGQPARILRGYIRRADFDQADPVSKARLYFMYNPESITREYVSYLDQAALDPFNTVYQSNNLVAPPSYMDFSFELFFDRQEEAMAADHPGVYVDYQFFDLVVRNVIPTDPNATSSTLPDNGIMMVNPRDITVIFSPQLTVQGRPLNATVTFEKFTHRMTPTRMRITLTVRVLYMGPVKDMVAYTQEQFTAEAAIPIDELKAAISEVTFGDIVLAQTVQSGASASGTPTDAATTVVTTQTGTTGVSYDSNEQVRLDALNWAKAHVTSSTVYNNSPGGRTSLNADGTVKSADCSGLVYLAYQNGPKMAAAMNWNGAPSTSEMVKRLNPSTSDFKSVQSISNSLGGQLNVGDLLLRSGSPGHVVFVSGVSLPSMHTFEAASTSAGVKEFFHSNAQSYVNGFQYLVRPMPLGANMVAPNVSLKGVS